MSARDLKENTEGQSQKDKPSSRDTWKKERTKTKLSYMEQKEYDSIESEIESLEERIAALDEEMVLAATDFVKLGELSKEREEKDRILEEKLERYMELQDMVDSFG